MDSQFLRCGGKCGMEDIPGFCDECLCCLCVYYDCCVLQCCDDDLDIYGED